MKFIKLITSLFLISVIISALGLLFLITFLKFGNGMDSSDIVRKRVIKYSFLVQLARLDQPGDYKYFYLKKTDPKIYVHVFYLGSKNPNDNLKTWIDEMIFDTIGKEVVFRKSELKIAGKSSFSDDDLDMIKKDTTSQQFNSPVLYLFYMTKRSADESNIGLTIHKDTIFLFKDTLDELSKENDSRMRLERSTIYHEWGHLLGLDHIVADNCIMSERVDVYQGRYPKGMEIPIKYCPETLIGL